MLVALLTGIGLCALLALAPAAAASSGEGHVTRFDVELTVRPDGALAVNERIEYAFDGTGHGIERAVPLRYRYDDTRDRLLEVSDVRVSSATDAPVDLAEDRSGGWLNLRVGDADEEVRGTQVYAIDYLVTGALNAFAGSDELYWDAIGDQWGTDIEAARISVSAPEVTSAECFAGTAGSRAGCGASAVDGATASFGPVALRAGEAMTVVVSLPKGAVAVPAPVLEERWTAGTAFEATPATLGLAALALAAGGAGVAGLARRRGRDERVADQVAGRLPAGGADPAGPVDWRAVEAMRPGLMGTLVDERADVADVTATVVDLAVRGHLRIEELPGEGRRGRDDWRLVRLDADRADLLPYETQLLDDLFAGTGSIQLSELRTTFHAQLQRLRGALYDEVVTRGWYPRRPDRTRAGWYGVAAGAVVAAVAAAVLLAAFTSYGLVGAALVVPAVALVLAAHRMPARTAAGSAALAQVLAVQHYLRTAQAEQLRVEESQQVFSRLLPYALALGESKRWTEAFRPVTPAWGGAVVPFWYVGPHGFDGDRFGSSLQAFSATAGSALSAAAAGTSGAGGGGSAGGGVGGGGGGGW